MITLIWVPGSWYVHHHQFWIQCQWSRNHYELVLCSAHGTHVWIWLLTEMWIHEWLWSIDIISGCNSIQAASNNKYADKDKYKWAVNMYKCLTVDLLDLHPPMALNANSFGFHIVSCKYIYPHMQFFMTVWNNFMMQHELGLNVTTVVWMVEIYE